MWKKYKYRIIDGIIIALSIIAAWLMYDFILEPSQTNIISKLDIFSYIGTIVTICAFLITITEILHSVSITRSVQDETNFAIQNLLRLKHASKLSFFLSALDSINDHINNIEYLLALKDFRFVRTFMLEDDFLKKKLSTEIPSFSEIENLLIIHRKASAKAPMAHDDVKQIRSFILECKAKLETQTFDNDTINPSSSNKDSLNMSTAT